MYGLPDVRRAAQIYIFAAPLAFAAAFFTTIAAFGTESLPDFAKAMVVTLLIFGVGYFLLQVFTAAFAYKRIAVEKTGLNRLNDDPKPPRPMGLPVERFELILVVFAIIVAAVLSISLEPNQAISGGGIVVGWLVSTGLARARFARKIAVEEKEQERRFFFGDMNFGVRTSLAYVAPGEEPEPVVTRGTPVMVRQALADGTVRSVPQTQLQRRAQTPATAPRPAAKKRSSAKR